MQPMIRDENLHQLNQDFAVPLTNLRPKAHTWQPPILFNEYEMPLIKVELLPPILKDFAQSLAETTETPEAMAVMSILATLATALQGKFEVKPKKGDDYTEPLNIYVMTALPPANRKSAILKACSSPLISWEKQQKEILEYDIRRQASIYESEKEIIKTLRRKLKKGDTSLISEIADKDAQLKKPDSLPKLFINDATLESLATIVEEQNSKISIISDEGGIIDVVAGLYTGGNSNIDLLLKGWDGGACRISRKDRNIDINPLITVCLIVQPQVIQNMTGKKAFTGKGLLERFLYCLPKSYLGYRTNDKPPMPPSIKNAYEQQITKLLNITTPETPKILVVDEDAFTEWHDFLNAIEIDLRPSGRLSICQGWGGKICGQALRIAGLLHIAEYGESETAINKKTMEMALELCSLLTFHAISAFDFMNSDPDIKAAKKAWDWIESLETSEFKKVDLTKAMRHSRLNADKLKDILKILFSRNLISQPIKQGKKTEIYKVNPSCLHKEKQS